MDVREKLVELLTDNLPRCGNLPSWDNPLQLSCDEQVQRIADHLIMNGVTVQEWISVDDKLPEPKENAICINRHGDMMIGTYTEWGWMFPCYFEKPTHWMPIPHPPKGE